MNILRTHVCLYPILTSVRFVPDRYGSRIGVQKLENVSTPKSDLVDLLTMLNRRPAPENPSRPMNSKLKKGKHKVTTTFLESFKQKLLSERELKA